MSLTRRHLLAGSAAIGAASVSGLAPPNSAHAAAPMAGKQAPGFYRHKIGDYEVTILNEGTLNFPLQGIRNAGPEEVNAALESNGFPKGQLVVPYNATLVNTGQKLVLIDTGNGAGRAPTLGMLGANLVAAGIDPTTIDTVVISHFHGDHIGGLLTTDNKPSFATAEIMVPAKEWAFWMDEGNMSKAAGTPSENNFKNIRRVFGALGNKVTQYEAGKDVAPGIASIETPGHTPGHTSFLITSGTGKLLVQADITAAAALLIVHRPDWQIGGDSDPAQAIATRRKIYDMVATDRIPVVGFHFPFPAVGYIEKAGNGYRYIPAPWNPVV